VNTNSNLRLQNDICDQFEDEWTNGEKPSLGKFVEKAAPELQEGLARQLLPIDIEFRLQSAESLDFGSYQVFGEDFVQLAKQVASKLTPNFDEQTRSLEDMDGVESQQTADASYKQSSMIGPYKLLQKIGQGGMGAVWMAEQEKPVRRRVALKVIKSGLENDQVIARFEAERQALAMMNHQNIAQILDAGATSSGQPFFVMELVQGIPFNEYCDQNRLTIDDRLKLFVPVCNAIQHAHQKGIIHRDLKPSNVLVCLYDGVAVPKVIDFGLAKALQHETRLTDRTMFTEFGQVVGTLTYMSPEQAEMNQLDVDTRTDVYSLGVMLYELLTGSTPIDRETLKQKAILKVLESIREDEPPRPSARLSSETNEAVSGISQQRQIEAGKLRTILRGELDWIVMKSLEKDRSRRYKTANGLADDVNRFLNGEVVEAKPPSAVYRMSKFAGKHKVLAASTITVAAALLIGIAAAGWGLRQAVVARDTAIAAENTAAESAADAKRQAARAEGMAAREKEAHQATEKMLNENRELVYLSQMRAAKRAWDRRDVDNTLKVLHGQLPATGLKDMRDFGWRYMQNLLKDPLEDCQIATNVTTVEFSCDSKNVIYGAPGKLMVRSLTESRIVASIEGDWPKVTAISPSLDGKRVSFACLSSGKPKSKGQVIGSWTIGEKPHVFHVDYPHDLIRVIDEGKDSQLTIVATDALLTFDTVTETIKDRVDFKQNISRSAVSANRKWLAVGSKDRSPIDLWNLDKSELSGEISQYGPGEPAFNLKSMAFSPDKPLLYVSYGNKACQIVDCNTLKRVGELEGDSCLSDNLCPVKGGAILFGTQSSQLAVTGCLPGKRVDARFLTASNFKQVVASPDGNWLATRRKTEKGLDLIPIRRLLSKQFFKTDEKMFKADISPDGKTIACLFFGHRLALYNSKTFEPLPVPFDVKEVFSLAFSRYGDVFATGHLDGTIRIWNFKRGTLMGEFSAGKKPIGSLMFSPAAPEILFSVYENKVKMWNWQKRQLTREIVPPTSGITDMDVSPNGLYLATGDKSDIAHVWNIENGTQLDISEPLRKAGLKKLPGVSLDFSEDSSRLLTLDWGSTASILNLDQMSVSRHALEIWALPSSLEWIDDDKMVFIGGRVSTDGRANGNSLFDGVMTTGHLWDPDKKETCIPFPGISNGTNCAVLVFPGRQKIAVVNMAGSMRIIDGTPNEK